ncbi:MAG: hypothetical protein IJW49_01290 [Clostridia bacterium]|nr:hypothetical protein [Clostridia bacterium]
MTNGYINGNSRGRGTVVITKERFQAICLVLLIAATTVLLVMRDVNGTAINKYIFVAIALAGAVVLPLEKFTYLMCFFFPLYVGLPGNYITLIYLAKFIPKLPQLKLRGGNLLAALAVSMFTLLQNMFFGQMGLVQMMVIPGVFLILLLFSDLVEFNSSKLALFFALGTAAVGLIMLFATLNEYDMTDLLNLSTRLGATNTEYTDEEIMNVSIDPNYFGMFALTVISTAIPLLFRKKTSKATKLLLLASTVACIAVALIGLSRTFLLVLFVWIVLYLLSQRNFKSLILTVVLIVIGAFLVTTFLPDVWDTLLARFKDADMATANNRTEIIRKFLPMWLENLGSAMFGVGMFNCNVHCMPLQYLFGGGLVLSGFMLAFAFTLFNGSNRRHTFAEYLPMLTVVALSFTLPMANLLNFMFPIVYAGLYIKHLKSTD